MFAKFINKIKSLFIIEQSKQKQILSKEAIQVRKKPALVVKNNKRFLALDNNDCALVLHEQNQCEVIFTKLYDENNQDFTTNEELLMALAIFLKQPGFGEMLISEFQKIALNNKKIFKDQKNEKNKGK